MSNLLIIVWMDLFFLLGQQNLCLFSATCFFPADNDCCLANLRLSASRRDLSE